MRFISYRLVLAGFVLALLVGAGCARKPLDTPRDTPDAPTAPAYVPISVEVPAAQAPVGNPILARGKGIAFENTIQLRVRDTNERVLGTSFATAWAPKDDAPGPWRAAIAYEQPTTPTGFLEAYESSAKDGAELHLVRVPVQFATETTTLRIALIDAVEGEPGTGVCPMKTVMTEYRVPKTTAVARAAVEALMVSPPPIPPTNPELTSALAIANVPFPDVVVRNGTATVNFGDALALWLSIQSNDCMQRQALAQLTATLTQFLSVTNVWVTVNGKPLEPAMTERQNPRATLHTNIGAITVELYADASPKTVENFLKLARVGFYNGTKFHRVIRGFMIQGGDPNSKTTNRASYGRGGPGYTFADEINAQKLVRGSFAMANAGPNTNGSQFFIVTARATPWLDGKHTNFGFVVSGMEVVDAIEALPTGAGDLPTRDVVVERITVTE